MPRTELPWLFLALLALTTSALCQSTNLNLTLIFSAEDRDTCSTSNSSSGLTFTTSSVPVVSHCFNIEDLFGSNQTQGFVNQTDNVVGGSYTYQNEPAGISWSLGGLDEYETNTNYSHVWFRLHTPNPSGNDDYKTDAWADRRVNVYGGLNCSELPSSDGGDDAALIPWYAWSCWSEDEGNCGQVPYSVASFAILPGPEDGDEQDGKCLTFAERGAGSGRPEKACWAIVVAIVSVMTMIL